jgi:hypothetical protein
VTATLRQLRVACILAVAVGSAAAQIPGSATGFQSFTQSPQGQGGMTGSAQQGQGQQPRGPFAPTQPFVPGLQAPGASNPFGNRWSQPRPLTLNQGFPIFPSQFATLGGYTTTPDALTALSGAGFAPPAAAADEPLGWPLWARMKDKQPLPFAADRGLLIRHAERVWHRAAADEPFVPLAFHDKLRGVTAGSAIVVRTIGEFELLLHNSSRVIARGPTELHLDELSDGKVGVRVTNVSWLRIATTSREHAIALPGGGTLRIDAPAPAVVPSFLPAPVPMSAPLPGVTDVVVDRVSEPGWLGGRASLTNLGATSVRWIHAAGEVKVAPGHRIVFFVADDAPMAGGVLELGGASREDAGDSVVCRATKPASVGWSGAAFDLPAGASVRFEPQAGRPFAAAPAAKQP